MATLAAAVLGNLAQCVECESLFALAVLIHLQGWDSLADVA
jgi:hypothetical protein